MELYLGISIGVNAIILFLLLLSCKAIRKLCNSGNQYVESVNRFERGLLVDIINDLDKLTIQTMDVKNLKEKYASILAEFDDNILF